MPNLNSLTLCLYIIRLTVIDGINLNEEILNTFIFHICTIMLTSETNHFLSANDIPNTFSNWKYSPVGCNIDHFLYGHTFYHIHSIPFQMTCFMYLTNICCGHHFQFVICLMLYDTHPFEHDFFQCTSRAFPLLKYLIVSNLISQKKINVKLHQLMTNN
jgi:hypothetical protein